MQQMTAASATSIESQRQTDVDTIQRTRRSIPRRSSDEALAVGLGWFSIGLGLAELVAPRRMARMIGVRSDRHTREALMSVGVRELASGFGILAARRRAGWLWFRLGGDLMDLALLGSAAVGRRRADGANLGVAIAAVAGAAALDAFTAQRLGRAGGAVPRLEAGPQRVTEVITIKRSREDVYQFWRQLANLPPFMAHVVSVELRNETTSHWTVTAAAGRTVEWDAEIVEDRPNELIAWRSLEGSQIENAGTVRFSHAPGGRGTEVRVELVYHAPGGRLGAALAKLIGREAGQQTKSDLRRLKQVLETGEVVHSDASIHAGMHAAQPFVHKPRSLKSPALREVTR
jgi:uncharacterized membrane protein